MTESACPSCGDPVADAQYSDATFEIGDGWVFRGPDPDPTRYRSKHREPPRYCELSKAQFDSLTVEISR